MIHALVLGGRTAATHIDLPDSSAPSWYYVPVPPGRTLIVSDVRLVTRPGPNVEIMVEEYALTYHHYADRATYVYKRTVRR